jgi:hypothetical protein
MRVLFLLHFVEKVRMRSDEGNPIDLPSPSPEGRGLKT